MVDTSQTFSQVRLIIATALLFYPNSIFRIARLASNKLTTLVVREVALIEDILASLEFIGRSRQIPTDTTNLSNAYTALLALDASESVKNRPELSTFSRNIGKFARDISTPVVDSGEIVMSGEEAKIAVRTNFDELKTVHDQMVRVVKNIRDLRTVYDDLDIPSLVASTAFTNIRSQLDIMQSVVETGDQVSLEEKSKSMLLKSLAAKSAVSIVSDTEPPSELLYRGPSNPYPTSRKYHGRVIGSGTPASVLSESGPWELPMSADLELSVDGGASTVIDLSVLYGATLTTRNSAPFNQGAGDSRLFVLVDPEVYEGQVTGGGIGDADLSFSSPVSLGYKHVGAPIHFPGIWSPGNTDEYPRYINHLGLLATVATGSFDSGTQILTASTWGAGRANFDPSDVGKYIQDNTVPGRWEIYEFIDATHIKVRAPSLDFTFGLTVRGVEGTSGNVLFAPALVVPLAPTWIFEKALIGPTSKAAQLTGVDQTAVDLAADLNGNNGSSIDENKLGYYCEAYVSPTDPDRVSIRAVSTDPYLKVAASHIASKLAAGGGYDLYTDSAHRVLGLFIGEQDSGDLLYPTELAEYINQNVSGATASVIETDQASGAARTAYNASTIVDASADFVVLGVAAGWQVELVGGTHGGMYRVELATATELTLAGVTFSAAEDVRYRLFTQQIQIESDSDSRGSSVEVVSGPAEMGFPTGVQYGSILYFEALDNHGAAQVFSNVEEGDQLTTKYGTVTILGNEDGVLELSSGLPAADEKIQFEVRSAAASQYGELSESLTVWVKSKSLLRKYGFDESLDQLDSALSTVFASARGQQLVRRKARKMLVDLLSILTGEPLRADEYREPVPTASLNLKGILDAFSSPDEDTVSTVLSTLEDRGFDRAAALLLEADLSEVFAANDETATYAGAITSAVRTALYDLPAVSGEYRDVQDEMQFELENLEIDDPEVVVEEDEDWFEEYDL